MKIQVFVGDRFDAPYGVVMSDEEGKTSEDCFTLAEALEFIRKEFPGTELHSVESEDTVDDEDGVMLFSSDPSDVTEWPKLKLERKERRWDEDDRDLSWWY